MFRNTLRMLEQLNGTMTYKMDVLPDEDGYYDKECPNEKCLSKFKVNAEDWKNLFSDEAVFCPFCGHSAPSRSWWTTEQIEQAKEQAINQVSAKIGQALEADAREFNRSQPRKSFIKMSMKFSGRTSFINLPASALEEMEQKIQCEKCGARYAVVGSAFYCPCCGHISDIDLARTKWIPYHKGGEMRKWYGNHEYVVNWSRSSEFNRAKTTMTHVYLKPCVTWSDISGNSFAGRYCYGGFMFDVKGSCAFASEENLKLLIGIFNSKVTPIYIEALNPTTTTQVGDLKRIPLLQPTADKLELVKSLVMECVRLSKNEWDAYEFSWDFPQHPLKRPVSTVADAFAQWEAECNERFDQLKANEEELNRIFIDIYGLQDELTPEVEDKDVTVRKADLQRDIKSLLSYAVGCMFGRYSLDTEGLAYAGGDWDESNYKTFLPDADGILPITDEEYLGDDIVTRLCSWLKVVYGEDTLEENLDFIAKALGSKGSSSREIIRSYFLKDFFKDHCKIYQKRPIYWLFDSGKQNGFKALIYLHRYTPDTIGNLRVDYLHKMQRVYESEIGRMQDMIDHSTNSREVAVSTKRKEKLQKQLKECRDYDEMIAHLALNRIELDLDDGVKVNYRKIQTAADGKFYEVLADSKSIMAKEK